MADERCCPTGTDDEESGESESCCGSRDNQPENCMVCGTRLEYLDSPEDVTCDYCGKRESGYVQCPEGHYVCSNCHGKGAFELVREYALSSKEKDPLAIAETLMDHPSIPFLGCEHGLIASASFLKALKNEGTLDISDEQIVEAMERTRKQALSSYCALTGICGVPIGIGASFSVILGASCPKDRESAITMHSAARVIEAIANDVGPMCCKSFVRTSLGVGYNLAKEYLNIDLPIRREKISCHFSSRHPHGCRGGKCHYFSTGDNKLKTI